MILTDREIQIALQQKHVTIDPPPTPDAYASTSVDLTLGRTFAVWEAQEGGPIRPGTPGFNYTNFIRNQKIEEGMCISSSTVSLCLLGREKLWPCQSTQGLQRAWRGKAHWHAWVLAFI